MKYILPRILLGFVIAAHCARVDISTKLTDSFPDVQDDLKCKRFRTEDGFGASPSQNNFSGVTETVLEDVGKSKQEEIQVNQSVKGIATESWKNDSDLRRLTLKTISEREFGRTLSLRREARQSVKGIRNNTRTKRQVLKGLGKLDFKWNNSVFYMFNTSDKMVQKVFKMGVKVWTEATCIDFVEDRKAKDKVVVVKAHGSWSEIGRRGGEQLLSLNDFLTPSSINEFDKVDLSQANFYGLRYDYGSIVHYDEHCASVYWRPTIFSRDPYYQKTMGSDLISFSDIFMINQHYGCNEKCNKSTSAKCANEGFPHPRNCSICICPGGYGGALCDQRPPGCGEDLVATAEKQTVDYTLGGGHGFRDHFEFCNYMITAPDGKKIEVDLRLFSSIYDNAGCTRGGVEIKAQRDQKLTGYRVCSIKGTDGPKVTNSSRIPVILYNRLDAMRVTFTYRYIH